MTNERENFEAELIAKNGINAELNTTNDYGEWVLRLKEMYEQTGDEKYLKAAEAVADINREEVVHAGEFSKILSNINPEFGEAVQEGMNEVNDLDGTVNDPQDPLADKCGCKDGIFENIINGGLNFMNTVSRAGEIDADPFAKVNDAFKSDELVRIISDKFNKLGKATIEKHMEDLKASGNYRNLKTRLIWDVIRATSNSNEIVSWYDKYDANDDHITSAGRKALRTLGISAEDRAVVKDNKMTVDRMVQIITPIVREFAKKKGLEDYWAIHKNGKNVSVGIEIGYRGLEELCDLLNSKLESITESYFEPADAGLIETTIFDATADKKVTDAEERKSKYWFCPDDSYGQHGSDYYPVMLTKQEAEEVSKTRVFEGRRGFLTNSLSAMSYYVNDKAVCDTDDMWELDIQNNSTLKYEKYRCHAPTEQEAIKTAKAYVNRMKQVPSDWRVIETAHRVYDSAVRDETIKTPRGTMQVSEKTEEELKKEGYGYWFTAEVEGKTYRVLNNGTLAIAVKDSGYTLGEKYRWEKEYGNLPLYLVKVKSDEVKLNANGKIVIIPKDKFEDYLKDETITPVSTQEIKEYSNVETLKDYKVKVGDRTFVVKAKDAKQAAKKVKNTFKKV